MATTSIPNKLRSILTSSVDFDTLLNQRYQLKYTKGLQHMFYQSLCDRFNTYRNSCLLVVQEDNFQHAGTLTRLLPSEQEDFLPGIIIPEKFFQDMTRVRVLPVEDRDDVFEYYEDGRADVDDNRTWTDICRDLENEANDNMETIRRTLALDDDPEFLCDWRSVKPCSIRFNKPSDLSMTICYTDVNNPTMTLYKEAGHSEHWTYCLSVDVPVKEICEFNGLDYEAFMDICITEMRRHFCLRSDGVKSARKT